MRMLRFLCVGMAVAAAGCQTQVTSVSAVGLDKNNRPVSHQVIIRDENGDIVKPEPVKRVRVGFGDDGKVQDEISLTDHKKMLPPINPFGDLKVDKVAGKDDPAATQPAASKPEDDYPPAVVMSKIVFQGWAGHGSPPQQMAGGWGRGTELLPRQTIKAGETKTVTLGNINQGGQVVFDVDAPDRRHRVPVRVTLTLWGSRNLRRTWTALLAPGEAQTFDMTTREREQIQFEVIVDAQEGITPGQTLEVKRIEAVEPKAITP